jgi:hypothetical protein
MIAVPRIKYGFFRVMADGSRLVKWRLGVLGFKSGVGIQGL